MCGPKLALGYDEKIRVTDTIINGIVVFAFSF